MFYYYGNKKDYNVSFYYSITAAAAPPTPTPPTATATATTTTDFLGC